MIFSRDRAVPLYHCIRVIVVGDTDDAELPTVLRGLSLVHLPGQTVQKTGDFGRQAETQEGPGRPKNGYSGLS